MKRDTFQPTIHKRRLIGSLLSEDGSVSIYLIIATSAIFLVMSVLIDYARIAAFQKQTELAAKSGIRSALSAYDGMLYKRYGLFGAGGTDRNDIFAEAARRNWSEASDEAFQVLNVRYESSHINSYETLGRHDIMERQVLEDMKYKAPIDFTLEIASRFVPAASTLQEAQTQIKMLEQVRKLYDKRELHLQNVLELQKVAAEAAEEPAEFIPYELQHAVTGDTVAKIVAKYSTYRAWVQAESQRTDPESPSFAAHIASYRRDARTLASDLANKSTLVLRRHQELERKALEELAEADRLNEQMKQVIEQSEQTNSGTGYDRLAKANVPGAASSSASQADVSGMQEVGQSADQLLLGAEWFASYKREISEQTVTYASFDSEAAGFQSTMNIALSSSGSLALLTENAAQLRLAYEQYVQRYGLLGSAIMTRAQELQQRQAADKERKKQEAKAESKLGEIRQLLHGITTIPQVDEHQEVFDQVKNRYENNLAFNEVTQAAAEAALQAGDPQEQAVQSMENASSIFTGMADLLDGARDSVYLNEYVINRFSTFEPQKLGAVFMNADPGELGHAMSLNNQETEYILYGFHNPTGNIAAAFGELFAMRLAIRTMEGLMVSKSLGHPLLVLASAIVYGLEKTMEDLLSFTRTGSAPLSKYIPVEVTYRDYLRLFMLMHHDKEEQLARTIAMIEQNTGLTLANMTTGVTGELNATVNLWFLPGVMNSFTKLGLLGGKVAGNRYEASKTIGMSYS
ncbi:hypothetical protein FHS18_005028 [Paenibacillus phyllosphaerae]|uniref:Uncharacterized protein n=1 Tax=Paenibacillus phyllosphaerae TaxID=274593 RepID=A0A7W5B3C9_9BACL|nr:hypothetical protein [Paenibacillus phyllosphaerae]MBB3112926.1 hypothetical protein [Paenibacillus phyllosphaerae]